MRGARGSGHHGGVTDLSAAVRARLLEGGDSPLPSLTREELIVLGDDPVLRHSHDELWWSGLDEGAQALVRETAMRGLVARGLLVPKGQGLDISEDARIVLQVRRGPSTVVVAREPADQPGREVVEDGPPAPEVSVLGIDLAEGERSAYVFGSHVSGIASHRLLSPERGTNALAGWLLRPPPAGLPVVARTLEVLRPHSSGEGVEVSRVLLMTDGSSAHVSDVAEDGSVLSPELPEPKDNDAVRTWVGELLDARAG